jgi:hypothetical protein
VNIANDTIYHETIPSSVIRGSFGEARFRSAEKVTACGRHVKSRSKIHIYWRCQQSSANISRSHY